MAEKKLNIQKAIKRPGAFTAWCKKHGFSGSTESCIAYARSYAKKRKNTRLLRQANFAKTLKSLHGGKK